MKNLLFAAALALSAATYVSAPSPARAAEERVAGPMMVFFGPNSSVVEGQAIPILENVKEMIDSARMRGTAKPVLLVEAYADPAGETQVAAQLSQSRGKAVRDFLIGQGIPASAIVVRPRGIENPTIDGATEPEKLNRRVEIYVLNGEP